MTSYRQYIMTVLVLVCGIAAAVERPNIIIIMTDDMGFSDIGCYGSEIETPNLDRLAANGLRFTQFYNAGRCCPTRASLLTGLYSHQAGIGSMTKDQGPSRPGYRGRLMERCVTIAEALGPAGYHSIQTGKWHVGSGKKAWWPRGRGFDSFFGSPSGGGFYFRPSAFNRYRDVVRNDEVLYTSKKDPPRGWYTTDAYTDEGLAFVRQALAEKKPFFWYLAYNAPHWPLRAKPEDIAKYRGRYKIGWDAVRQKRRESLVELGIIEDDWKLSPRTRQVGPWEGLSEAQKDTQDLRMATYAAMIDCVDQNVGKIIAELKAQKAFDNTLIMFLCDNGGCAEGGVMGSNKGKGVCGTAESFAYYGSCWANASNAPFRRFKAEIHEGGISTPLVAHWPRGIAAGLNGTLVREPAHVIDLMATCVGISGATYPKERNGHAIVPLAGQSMQPLFQGETTGRAEPLFFEHNGSRGIRHGQWKLVAAKKGKWELYDMHADRTELNDLATAQPERVQAMAAQWESWAKRSFVTR